MPTIYLKDGEVITKGGPWSKYVQGCKYDSTLRIFKSNPERATESINEADDHDNGTPESWHSIFLSNFLDKPIDLTHIVRHDHPSALPSFIYGYREL